MKYLQGGNGEPGFATVRCKYPEGFGLGANAGGNLYYLYFQTFTKPIMEVVGFYYGFFVCICWQY